MIMIIWVICLSAAAVEDLRYREISMRLLALGLVPGVANLFAAGDGIWSHGAAAGIGIVMLLLSKATRGAMGEGDGLFFLLTACYLDFREILTLFLASLAFSCVWGTGILLKGRLLDRETLGRTVPFLACAWLPGILIACRYWR